LRSSADTNSREIFSLKRNLIKQRLDSYFNRERNAEPALSPDAFAVALASDINDFAGSFAFHLSDSIIAVNGTWLTIDQLAECVRRKLHRETPTVIQTIQLPSSFVDLERSAELLNESFVKEAGGFIEDLRITISPGEKLLCLISALDVVVFGLSNEYSQDLSNQFMAILKALVARFNPAEFYANLRFVDVFLQRNFGEGKVAFDCFSAAARNDPSIPDECLKEGKIYDSFDLPDGLAERFCESFKFSNGIKNKDIKSLDELKDAREVNLFM
jgi:hypothetical protein